MDWERLYQDGDTPWEKGSPAPPLLEWLETHSFSGKVLVPGCGLGHDVRAIAATGCQVVGLDVAPTAIGRAESFPKAGRERYRLDDFLTPPAELVGQFDWIFEHTCFCAIHPSLRSRYVEAAAACLVPGGHLLSIFFLDPGTDGDGPPYGTTRAELSSLFSPTFDLLTDNIPTRSYPGREGREIVQLLRLKSL